MRKKGSGISRLINSIALNPQESAKEEEEIWRRFNFAAPNLSGPRKFVFKEFLNKLSAQNVHEAKRATEKMEFSLALLSLSMRRVAWYIKDISDEEEQTEAFYNLEKLVIAAYASEYGDRITDPLFRRYILAEQSRVARERRGQNDEESALLECINAEVGDVVISRPHKIAVAVMEGVNKRLGERGLKPVKIDKIARRLKKWPRS